jgi:hypothetical protein
LDGNNAAGDRAKKEESSMREDFIKRIEQLAEDAYAAKEYTIAGPLFTLLGALLAGHDEQLRQLTARFSDDALKGMESDEN